MRKQIVLFLFILVGYISAVENIDSLKTLLKNNPHDYQARLHLGIAYHNLGVNGDKNAVKMGEEILKELVRLENGSALALGYYGSVLSLKARDSRMPWNKSKYAKQGLAKIDSAVYIDPEQIQLRMLRAMNSYQVPKFMKRLEIGIKDYNYIIESTDFSAFSPDKKAMVYLNLAKSYSKNGQKSKAKYYFRMSQEISPISKYGLEATQILKDNE